ncbi:MAG: DUF1080 domain-containing protein [Acidobacteriota bacterium]|nr:MAG: DUF1080 domain-containing protein [Acidobacteriota bacterium]
MILSISSAMGLAQEADADGFRPLFDGKTLNGWVQHGGKATYEVVDDAIVGTSVPDTPNSFLCTDRDYADFILELEFKVDDGLNSGIQIRSLVFDHETTVSLEGSDGKIQERKIPADRVHGYQVEIDTSERAWTGGIYDEARRGWLFNLENDEVARGAFRQGEWNRFRIEAVGDSIQTWVNGTPVAKLTDDMTLSGLIALQVHGVGNRPDRVGKQIRWRNIRIKEIE